jgi:hypothetical protein
VGTGASVIRLNLFYRHSGLIGQFQLWLQGFGEICDGVVTLFSFGLVTSSFELRIARWRTISMFARKKKEIQ